MLHREGVPTGVDLDALVSVARWLSGVLGRPLPGHLHTSGTPLLDTVTLVIVGRYLGFWLTVAIVILSGVIGAQLARQQGFAAGSPRF